MRDFDDGEAHRTPAKACPCEGVEDIVAVVSVVSMGREAAWFIREVGYRSLLPWRCGGVMW